MPAVLADTNICDPYVPGAWLKVLEDLRAFVDLEAEIRASECAPSPAQFAALAALHERLTAMSAMLLEPAALADLSEAELSRLFARAVVCTMRIKQCIVADGEVLDTAGSRTLALYEADFYGTAENMAAVRAALAKHYVGISEHDLYEIESQVQADLADAHRKQAVVRALRDEFHLHATQPDLPGQGLALFQALFPGVPLLAEEVKPILTSTLVFFCLPFAGDQLTSPRLANLPDLQQAALNAFFSRARRFVQSRFANFPAFGFLQLEELDPDLVSARLASRAGLTPAEVARELARMVTILPIDELEMYLVHDVWGHGWQASLLNFERMYEEMAEYADPLRLEEMAESGIGQRICFRDCFVSRGAELRLDEKRFRQFVHGELAERLTVAMSAVLAELIADVAEFKLLAEHPHDLDLLPSSSHFKLFPSKLDLTLQDLPFYFQQATKGFRLWAKSAERQQVTCDELLRAGAAPEAALAAVAHAVEIWHSLAAEALPQLSWQAAGDQLQVNVFMRAALNFLGIHRAMLEAYQRLEDLPHGALPLKSYRDLLVLGAAVFFEADRGRNLWRIDEYLSLRFVPLCRKLGWGEG